MKSSKHILPFCLALAICLTACRKVVADRDMVTAPEMGKVVEVVENVHLSLEEAKALVKDTMLCNRMKYGITCYKIVYKTLLYEDMVNAEALLCVPDYVEGDTPEYAAYFHGTILPFKMNVVPTDTPSQFKGTTKSKDILLCILPIASSGFCTITPDYTGYGPTKGNDHPFVFYPELYKSSRDGLIAGRTVLLDKLNIKIDPKKIWLSGWSQGGGMSLYAQKIFESTPDGDFTVMANSTLAGPFNITHFMKEMMDHPDKTYLALALYSWAAYAINDYAQDMMRPLDQIFRPEIYDQTSAILLMSNTPAELFQDFFMKKIREGEDVHFIAAMDAASTSSGWTPKANIYMHHGTADPLVPYFNMTDAYEGLKHSGKVFMFPKEGGKHDNFVPEYTSHTIDVFRQNQ